MYVTSEEVNSLDELIVSVMYFALDGRIARLESTVSETMSLTLSRSEEIVEACRNLPATNEAISDDAILAHLEWFKGMPGRIEVFRTSIAKMKVELLQRDIAPEGLYACASVLLTGLADLATKQETYWTHAMRLSNRTYLPGKLH